MRVVWTPPQISQHSLRPVGEWTNSVDRFFNGRVVSGLWIGEADRYHHPCCTLPAPPHLCRCALPHLPRPHRHRYRLPAAALPCPPSCRLPPHYRTLPAHSALPRRCTCCLLPRPSVAGRPCLHTGLPVTLALHTHALLRRTHTHLTARCPAALARLPAYTPPASACPTLPTLPPRLPITFHAARDTARAAPRSPPTLPPLFFAPPPRLPPALRLPYPPPRCNRSDLLLPSAFYHARLFARASRAVYRRYCGGRIGLFSNHAVDQLVCLRRANLRRTYLVVLYGARADTICTTRRLHMVGELYHRGRLPYCRLSW